MENIKPWQKLEELLETNQLDEIKDYLTNLSAEEVASAINHLKHVDQSEVVSSMTPVDAAEMMDDLPDVLRGQLLDGLSSENAAAIINEFSSDDQADVINNMEDDAADAILEEMHPSMAENVRQLIQYGPDTAGGLMITEYLAFDQGKTVGEVADRLRSKSDEFKKFNIQYIYVTTKNRFTGVLRTRDLLLSNVETLLSEIVIANALTVEDTTPLDELIRFFDKYDFYGVPVLHEGSLVGVVLRKNILEAETEKANLELLETQGIVGGEELRTMPLLLRSRRRLSWLSVNILLNIVAASVIAFYQDTLSSVIALAVFLPVISDMSGCSGNQAVAVSLRELSLGVLKPYEVMRVWWQEVSLGLINGLVLGTLIGLAAYLWKGNIYFGLVAGGALAINTVVAVSIGGTIPLILKRFNADPALASGPILTTITDMFGFFLALTFAGLFMSKLV